MEWLNLEGIGDKKAITRKAQSGHPVNEVLTFGI
jgi:hypothetical protein